MINKLLSWRKYLTGAFIYWCLLMVSNLFNWLFNVHAGRILIKDDFAILTVFLSFEYLLSVPSQALSTAVGRYTAYYNEKGENEKSFYFFRQYWWLSWAIGILLLVTFLIFRDSFVQFFGFDYTLFVIFLPILIPLFLLAFEKGTLLGKLAICYHPDYLNHLAKYLIQEDYADF